MSLGKTLADLRKRAGLTQAELGEKLSISAQAISKWENDISEPDISTLKKIAQIYEIPVANIITPESADGEPKSNAPEGNSTPTAAPFYDLYLTGSGTNKLAVIKRIREMLGYELKEAKDAVENPPFLISGRLSAEEATEIGKILTDIGAAVERKEATNLNSRRNINTAPPEPASEPKGFENTMLKRFIIANITAVLPAVASLIVICSMGFTSVIDVLLCIYLPICTYATIFLLWYPTVLRKLVMKPLYFILDFDGC